MSLSIPSTISELRDLIAYMVLRAPSMETSILPHENIDTVFYEFYHGLDNIRSKIGEAAYIRLRAAAQEVKALCELGDNVKAPIILQHIDEYIRLKKYRTDEEVVDASRFEQ